jgi:sugar O-acyltransferase (sialic acid O-acetyltransferase NeuD family)
MIVGIIGNGGLGREVKSYLDKIGIHSNFFVSDEYYDNSPNTIKLSEFDTKKYSALVCIADVFVRERIVNSLPKETEYFTFIHSTAQIYSNYRIGTGSIIGPNVVITTDTKIGNHVLINYNTTIGHDTTISDYCTINPNSSISGNCDIGKNVFIGCGSYIREKVKICRNVVIGMGSVVVKDITKSGTYIGVPSKEMKYAQK